MTLRTKDVYSPLDPRYNEIRLITIEEDEPSAAVRCTMSHASLDQLPRYQALSYVWGDPSDTIPISLSGSIFPVTVNLYQALIRLRSKNLGPLWIDAICINQQDVPERNQQVLLMGPIYRRATRVVIWLGEDSRTSEKAFEWVNGFHLDANLQEADKNAPWKPVYSLLRRRYWQRMWIIQEVVLAHEIVVCCGCQEAEWSAFSSAVQAAIQRQAAVDRMRPEITYFNKLIHLRHVVTESADHRTVSFFEALRQSTTAQATDRRDKVYGILGLVHDGDIYVTRPNYRASLEDLCLAMTLGHISGKRSLDPVVLLGRGADDESVSSGSSPSWIPRWHSLDENRFQRPLAYLTGSLEPQHSSPLFCDQVNTANSSECRATYDRGKLTCRGIYVGAIKTISGSISDAAQISPSNTDCTDVLENPYHTKEETFKAIYSCFFCSADRFSISRSCKERKVFSWGSNETYPTEFLRVWRSSYHAGFQPDTQTWINSHKDFSIHGSTLQQWAQWKTWTREGMALRRRAARRRKNNLLANVHRYVVPDLAYMIESGSRLIVTDHGYVGWAPIRARLGDHLYILEGSSIPAVVRPVKDGEFQLVGDGWVQGLMTGSAIRKNIIDGWADIILV
ncbi:heterokaryon incompatibility protein-domain-containing protein [Hypoxylon fuscum]|nr:heterokaryon incompatibility protein-domain-containing protein [Hypoxylon fuscum]